MAAATESRANRAASAPLRVGIVTTSFPVPSNPSSGIFVKRLVARLPSNVRAKVLIPCPDTMLDRRLDARYELDCFAYGPRRWMRVTHRPGGIPDAIRRRDPAILLLPLLVPAMFIACLRLAIQVDVMHGNWSVPGLIAVLAAKLRERPAIVTLRGEDVTRAASSWVFRWVLAACLRFSHRIVVVSESMRDNLQRQFRHHAHKIEFIPNGVTIDHPDVRPAFRAPLRLVTVSSLIQRKRITTLLQALTYPGAASGVILRIVGDGPQRLALESMASELGVRQRVEFVGGVPPAEVAKQLGWGDLFVFASESEGRPNVILEAMAAGVPIISTDIPGVRELIHPEGGLLYAVGEAQSLAQCINSMAEDPVKARNMGLTAQGRIQASGLTWTATANRYATLYHDVASPLADHSCAD